MADNDAARRFKLVKNKGFRYQWGISDNNFVEQTNECEIAGKTETFRPTIGHRMSYCNSTVGRADQVASARKCSERYLRE